MTEGICGRGPEPVTRKRPRDRADSTLLLHALHMPAHRVKTKAELVVPVSDGRQRIPVEPNPIYTTENMIITVVVADVLCISIGLKTIFQIYYHCEKVVGCAVCYCCRHSLPIKISHAGCEAKFWKSYIFFPCIPSDSSHLSWCYGSGP